MRTTDADNLVSRVVRRLCRIASVGSCRSSYPSGGCHGYMKGMRWVSKPADRMHKEDCHRRSDIIKPAVFAS